MIEKIFVMSRGHAKFLTEKENAKNLAIISICSSKKDIIFTKTVKKKMGCDNILNLIFADLTTEDYKIAPYLITKFPVFTPYKAERIIRLLDNLKENDVKLLIVHCDAGVSRSGAVGIFAVRYLGMDEEEFRREHPNIGPNTLVYDTLIRLSGVRRDYQSWWEHQIDDGKLF